MGGKEFWRKMLLEHHFTVNNWIFPTEKDLNNCENILNVGNNDFYR